jgi:hypothetical protein
LLFSTNSATFQLFLLNAACLAEKQQIPILQFLGLEPMVYRTQGEHSNHYTTDAVTLLMPACIRLVYLIFLWNIMVCFYWSLVSDILQRNLGSDLQFPSLQEITENTQPTREIEIPITFTSLSMYKQVFTAGLKGNYLLSCSQVSLSLDTNHIYLP